MPTDHPEPAPDAEKPVAGQPEGKARRYVYRRTESGKWETGWIGNYGWFWRCSIHDTPEAAAIAATRLNGNEAEVDDE